MQTLKLVEANQKISYSRKMRFLADVRDGGRKERAARKRRGGGQCERVSRLLKRCATLPFGAR